LEALPKDDKCVEELLIKEDVLERRFSSSSLGSKSGEDAEACSVSWLECLMVLLCFVKVMLLVTGEA
jgi:hypothetical protein